MYHHPHYPPPAFQQQNNDSLGQDLYRGTEIVMIVLAIFGLWKYIIGPLWESVIVPLWNWWNKSFNTKQKLILLALLALADSLVHPLQLRCCESLFFFASILADD